jgi:hypothetical protein
MYSMGYSTVVGDAMETRMDPAGYRFPSAYPRRDDGVLQPMEDDVRAVLRRTANSSGPIDFYDEDSCDDGEGDDAGGSGDADDLGDSDEEAEAGRKRPPPSASASASASPSPAPAAAPAPAIPPPPPPPAAAVAAPSSSAMAVDLGLYVVSGIVLIFAMEQFVQIGTSLR